MKERMKKIMALIMVTAVALTTTACGEKAEKTAGTASPTSESTAAEEKTTDAPQEITTVRTAYSPFIGGIGVYVIEAADMDTEYGIDLKINAMGDVSPVMGIMTGDVDIAFNTVQGYMTAINALVEEGADPSTLPRIVYLHNESTGADGLVAKAEIKTLEDLKGKKVSAQYGNVTHYMLARALATAGMSIDDVEFVDMGPGKGGSAFIAGSLDAATTFDPYLTQAVNETGANLLISTKDLDRCIYDVCIVSAEVAEEKPEWLYNTLKCIEAATEYCNSDLNGAAELTADTFGATPEEVVDMCSTVYLYTMKDNVEAMAENGWLYDSLADIQDFYVSIGEMDPNIDFKALVDSDFLVKE